MTDVPPAALPRRYPSLRFLLSIAMLALLLRSCVFAPFSIPSESMQPRLLVGDYLFVAKWPYGYSHFSLPFSMPLFSGRILGSPPARGDVVVFRNPGNLGEDYVKRLIGLPGDQVQMKGGQLFLNGAAVSKRRESDFSCGADCRIPRYRETLPGGRSYDVLDKGYFSSADDTAVFLVPRGSYFMMGDNRDDSADSRFPIAQYGGGIGFVPAENLLGRAAFTYFSSDGSASWFKPWTWPGATRWDRIGKGFQ